MNNSCGGHDFILARCLIPISLHFESHHDQGWRGIGTSSFILKNRYIFWIVDFPFKFTEGKLEHKKDVINNGEGGRGN